MQGKKNPANDDRELVCGLQNISVVIGEPLTTTLRRAEHAEIPVAKIGHMFVGTKKLLLIARARREAARNAKRGATNETARANECEEVA
jgi:hypothetical protein